MGDVLAYVGAAVVLGWGVAHAIPVRTVLAGFNLTDLDNRRILTMEWLAEALTLVLLGVLSVIITAFGDGSTVGLVQCVVAAGLLAMAVLHLLLGARTAIRPMQICPAVLTISAGLLLTAGLI